METACTQWVLSDWLGIIFLSHLERLVLANRFAITKKSNLQRRPHISRRLCTYVVNYMYAASWRLGSHISRFHLCFWLFSGTIGQFSEASVLECTQQLWRPGSRSTHPSWRQFSKNNCIILTIFVQRPEISSFQKQRKIQNRPFCYICTMFSI